VCVPMPCSFIRAINQLDERVWIEERPSTHTLAKLCLPIGGKCLPGHRGEVASLELWKILGFFLVFLSVYHTIALGVSAFAAIGR